MFAEILQRHAPFGFERTVGQGAPMRRFINIVLVVDVADDLLHQIFDGDQPIGAAIFVDHQRQMQVRCLHPHQKIACRHGWRRHQKFAFERCDGHIGQPHGAVRRNLHHRDNIFDMDKTNRVVQRFAIDGQA